MDIISHGLWSGFAFGRKNKKLYWWAIGFGLMPDLFSFGILSAAKVLGLTSGPDWEQGLPDPMEIPQIIHTLYNITHSLIVFALVFGLVWFWLRKPFFPMLGWGLHLLMDIPTHSAAFFPTPFLWPLSDFTVNGIGWGQPIIFYPNIALLVIGYLGWWIYKKNKNRYGTARK
ncbi:MAG: metal-dependent hydrolase [Patescibacteria group bacterium]